MHGASQRNTLQRRFFSIGQRLIFVLMIVALGFVVPANAATTVASKPKITFTFDDGRASTIGKAAPTLAKYDLSGTAYITTGCVGMTKVPNTCHAANDVSYMTWAQIKTLQTTYGWEIGSHSRTHPYMASTNPDDGQPNMLTPQQIADELELSRADLAAQGINATAYASPYGDYNPYVLQEVAKRYASHRGFADQNDNAWPYNDLLLNNMPVQSPVTLEAVKAKVDDAIAKNLWLVLTFHDIVDKPSKNSNKYQWGTAQLDAVAAYVQTKQKAAAMTATNASGGLATGMTNLLPGADFTAGISNGWRTDNPSVFSADNLNNGSFPESTNSLRVNASGVTTAAHLFSPSIPVKSSSTYLLKSFLNVTAISSGEVGYYIDEYDSAGNWISGQYKSRESGMFAENINIAYTPTTARVASAGLQIFTTASSRATGYVDSFRWYEVSSSPPAAETNLLSSGTFDAPWQSGWRTDDTTRVAQDTQSHGAPANSINSIAVSLNNRTSHLFSPKVTVTPGKSYYLDTYMNITNPTGGEIGIYLDEYDTAGNWISGKYVSTRTVRGAGRQNVTYTPSSASVTSMSVQYIFYSPTALTAYLDDARFIQL